MPTLDWIGKKAVLNHHREVPYRLLKGDESLSVGDPGSGNLLVQGDNLLALKALLPYYAGRVKCIAIDPPYNTQSAFEQYDDNLEHSTWLSPTRLGIECCQSAAMPNIPTPKATLMFFLRGESGSQYWA